MDDDRASAVDLTVLRNFGVEMGEDGPHLVGHLIKIFLVDTPDKLAQLQTSLVQGEIDRLTHVAHNLKATAALLGARELSAICLQLEEMEDSGQLTNAAEIIAQLLTEYEQVKVILVSEQKKISESQ